MSSAGDLAVGQTNIIKSRIHVASVPDDGSLVMASVAAVADGDVAYSFRHGERRGGATAQHAAGARSNRWLWLLLLLVPPVVWMIVRIRG